MDIHVFIGIFPFWLLSLLGLGPLIILPIVYYLRLLLIRIFIALTYGSFDFLFLRQWFLFIILIQIQFLEFSTFWDFVKPCCFDWNLFLNNSLHFSMTICLVFNFIFLLQCFQFVLLSLGLDFLLLLASSKCSPQNYFGFNIMVAIFVGLNQMHPFAFGQQFSQFINKLSFENAHFLQIILNLVLFDTIDFLNHWLQFQNSSDFPTSHDSPQKFFKPSQYRTELQVVLSLLVATKTRLYQGGTMMNKHEDGRLHFLVVFDETECSSFELLSFGDEEPGENSEKVQGCIIGIAGGMRCVVSITILTTILVFKLARIYAHLQFDSQLLLWGQVYYLNKDVRLLGIGSTISLIKFNMALILRSQAQTGSVQIYNPLLLPNSIIEMLKQTESPLLDVITLPKTTHRRQLSNLNQLEAQVSSPANKLNSLELSYVLGTNHTNTVSANIYAYRKSELIYYLKNMFVKYNRYTRNYRIFYEVPNEEANSSETKIREDKTSTCTQDAAIDAVKEDEEQSNSRQGTNTLLISKYFGCGQGSLLAVLKKVGNFFYLSLFWAELEQPAIVIKISEDPREVYTNFTFHQKKGYIYLLYKLRKQHNSPAYEKQQYLKIIEIQAPAVTQNMGSAKTGKPKAGGNKFKILLNSVIKKTGGSLHDLDDLIVGTEPNQLYLFGLDYFRYWNVLFNQKSLKESNYRNTERNIKKEKIVQIFWISEGLIKKGQESWKLDDVSSNMKKSSDGRSQHNYLVVITAREVLFVRNNQLVHISPIPDQSPFEKGHRQTAELILQKSLNQIYKTKFRVDTITQENENEEQPEENKFQSRISAASKPWIENVKQGSSLSINNRKSNESQSNKKEQKCVKFCAAFDSSRIFIYRIQSDFSIKLEVNVSSFSNSEGIIPKQSHLNKTIKNISATPDGSLILFTDSLRQNFINSRTEDFESSDIHPIYVAGQGHTSSILSISSPEIVNNVVTVSDDGSLKIWNKSEKQRCLVIDTGFKVKPLEAIMHPCGFLTIVNFGMEIKVYGIVSNQLQEIVAVKTNDYCSGMQFSKVGNFLVTNEKNMIKVYDPFTLQGFGKIQPEDLRQEYRNFKISDNNEYIVYQCCNHKLYKLAVSSIFNPDQGEQQMDTQYKNQQKEAQFDRPTICHAQSQEYTCFYFDFGTVKHNTTLALEGAKSTSLSSNNIFVGFTRNKFMTIYSCFGQKLIAQFPIINGTYVTDCCVSDHLMFVATNKGTILTYSWPILESHLQIDVSNHKNQKGFKIARFKPPQPISQFIVWRDSSAITALHKIPNKNQLFVGGVDGILGLVSYHSCLKGLSDQQSEQNYTTERQRMIEATNNIKLVKTAQIEKISKLIEKTENDIKKIEYEVQNEKDRRNKQLEREENELRMNTLQREKAYLDERRQKEQQQQKQLQAHKMQYEKKKKHLQKIISLLEKDCKANADYEKQRIEQIELAIENQKKNHKNRILKLIETHRASIQKLKDDNLASIKSLQNQFETLVCSKYKQEEVICEVKQVAAEEFTENAQINSQKVKVMELEQIIADKSQQLAKITIKSDTAKKEDETMQKKFEKNLEKYNEYRYENLILHSELLKIQNQLYERKEILSKKDEIINMVYQQKQINETFKQFVSGAIFGLEDQKEKAYLEYIKKQQNLRMLFEELTLEINKSESKKLKLMELKQGRKILERENAEKTKNIKVSIEQLKNFKKYLLVQGVSEDTQHKKFYQEQQKLLSTIKWLEKRFRMNCINEKKMTVLKKSGVSQVVNQNKNLLEECNQLREEGIVYENEIEHLSKKLAEANMIIQLERKVSNQDRTIVKQSQKLNEIRKMFQDHIASNLEIQSL